MSSSTTTLAKPSLAAAAPNWDAIREQFPALKRFVYLDIARKATLPQWVEAAMREWMADIHERAGERAFSMDEIEAARESIARTFGAPARTLALIKNTSEGMNILAQGLGFAAGDNIVVSELEHENNTFPWRHLERRGVEIRFVAADADGRVPLDAYRRQLDSRTRLVAAAWVVYGNGFRTDVPALAELCHERGILLAIDGVQAAGILSTPVADLGADAVVCGGHKAMFSLAGAGFMYVREGLIDKIEPPYAAKFSFTSNDRRQAKPVLAPDCHRFEYGNPNFLGIWVQRRSAEEIARIGLANIETRVRALTTRLIELAEAKGIAVRTPRPWRERAGIVSFVQRGSADSCVKALRARGIVASAKDGFVRASVHFYNDENDLEAFVEALAGL